ncbi:MAG: dCTP deaminase [Blastocatellia bacterium]|jgi:deoxycytidine triphosphate deaminase|nr:dCTP deaminase [Blastocatellia bacterium]
MSVLTDSEIQKLVEEKELITEFSRDSLEGASYDMRVGRQYVKHGKIELINVDYPTLILQPGEFVVLRSLEELNMPRNLVGHNGIMSPWAKRGLVSLFSPQIDPGFCGFLTVPVFNAGDAPISINYMDKIFTVEFVRTAKNASYGWSERHGRQDRLVVPVAPSSVRPNLVDISVLQDEFRRLHMRFEQLNERQSEIDTELRVIQVRIGERREAKSYSIIKWTLLVAIATMFLALIVGVAGSDWMRTKALEMWQAISHGG